MRRRATADDGEAALLRRTARTFARLAAALVAATVLLLVAAAGGLVLAQQRGAADALLVATASRADDVGDPPPGTWLVLVRGGTVSGTPGLPDGLAARLAALRAAPRQPRLTNVGTDGRTYRVLTQRRGAGLVQVALDTRTAKAERDRLLAAALVAGGTGLLLAGVVGVLLGRRAVRPLGEALVLQRGFVADAGHELRTPLTLLSTRAQVLEHGLRRSGADPQTLRDAAGVVEDARRLGEVVEDLLAAADPHADGAFQPVDVDDLATSVVDSAREHAAAAGVRLDGRPGGAGRVSGAPAALRRALLALVDNAVEHTPAGGEVVVGTARTREGVVVTVSDTGSGVDPAVAQDVFRRFHSGGQRSGRRRYGLGLALARDVADRHGGQLRLARQLPGRGAAFELVLPPAR